MNARDDPGKRATIDAHEISHRESDRRSQKALVPAVFYDADFSTTHIICIFHRINVHRRLNRRRQVILKSAKRFEQS